LKNDPYMNPWMNTPEMKRSIYDPSNDKGNMGDMGAMGSMENKGNMGTMGMGNNGNMGPMGMSNMGNNGNMGTMGMSNMGNMESVDPMQAGMKTPYTYPEIYYIVQPHVLMECDNIEMTGTMPTQDMMDAMCSRIYDNVCRLHPNLKENDMEAEPVAVAAAAMPVQPYDRYDDYRRRRRDRGFDTRDLIRILLLNELFRRRRRY